MLYRNMVIYGMKFPVSHDPIHIFGLFIMYSQFIEQYLVKNRHSVICSGIEGTNLYRDTRDNYGVGRLVALSFSPRESPKRIIHPFV